VGAMVGGRGCIDDIGGGEYLVTVAWQGQAPSRRRLRASLRCGSI
jgi:type IV pilus assembly protein PilV